MNKILVLLISCFLSAVLVAEDIDPKKVRLKDVVTAPDRPRPYYKVFFRGQEDILVCSYFEHDKKEGKIIYAEAGNNIKITKTDNLLDRVEPRINPSELVTLRGEQLLAANKYARLHLDAQRELIKLLKWGIKDGPIPFGKEELDSPLKECADLVVKAAVQYPKNHELQEMMAFILKKTSDDRLEQALISSIKGDPKWDEGYAHLAEIMQEGGRDQELFTFVKNWVKRHPGSQVANKWAMRIALSNNDTETAKRAAQNLWLRNKNTEAGAEYAKILLFQNKGEEALKVANDVLALDATNEEMKIIAGSALLAQNKLAEADKLLSQASESKNANMQAMAKHNLGVLSWHRGENGKAKGHWKDLKHPATDLARAIANRRPINKREVLTHPAMAMTAGELNAALALEQEAPEKALLSLRPNHSVRHTFLKRVAELIQSNFSQEQIKLLNAYSDEESVLWRAYAYIQLGEYAKAEALLQDLPKDHGYAAVYRVYCAEGLKDSKRAEALFEIAKTAKNAPENYVSELESHYLTMKSSKELETFKWPAGDRLKTGWFSEAPKTGIHIFANGEYLAFSGTQKAETESRAWRKRSKERLRKIKAKIDPSQGWSGIEMMDVKGKNGLAISIELIGKEKKLVWRRLSDGKWGATWNTICAITENTITLMLDDTLIGNEQIQVMDAEGELVPLASLSDIPGSHMRVGFFCVAPSGTEVLLKVMELLFEVRPK